MTGIPLMLQPMLPLFGHKRPPPPYMFSCPPLPKMPKFDWTPDPQEHLPARPLHILHQFNQNIVSAARAPNVARIFLGCCEGGPEGAAVHLNELFKIWPSLVKEQRQLGVSVPLMGGRICALICRTTSADEIDFMALYKAAKMLANQMFTLGMNRVLFEGFIEASDQVVTFKVILD
jgi:hypothetical protein